MANHSSQPTILITGATGSNGTELMQRFTAHQIPVRAMTRKASHAGAIESPTTQIVEGDFGKPETLKAALEGIEKAFLLSNSTEDAQQQQLDFVEIARQSGVAHIVKLSQLDAATNSSARFLRYHARVEQAIQNSGIAHTFLRPNLFMQSVLGFADLIKSKRMFPAPMGEGAISIVDIRDIMDIAFLALTQAGHENKTYDITGPQALTHGEMAAQLSQALGHEITYVNVTPAEMRQSLVGAGFPAWQADGLLEEYAHWSQSEAAQITSDVADVTGHAPRNFADFARDYADALR